jgi:hypothetical protein
MGKILNFEFWIRLPLVSLALHEILFLNAADAMERLGRELSYGSFLREQRLLCNFVSI